MSARFRIRTPQGQELSFASEEMFADFVRSGELSEGDVVYDASTGEWSPALTHSLVLDIQSGSEGKDEGETGAGPATTGAEASGSGKEGTPDGSSEGKAGDLGFELAPEQTPEEASAAFVKELEAERAADQAFDRSREQSGLRADEGSAGLLRDIQREPPEPPRGRRGEDAPRDEGSEDAPRPTRKPPKRTRKERRADRSVRDAGPRRSVSGKFLAWMIVLAGLGIIGLVGPDLVALAMGSGGAGDEPAAAGPVLPDTEEAIAARADARFLGSVRPSLLGLPTIPSIWLDGRYLANASEYPEVPEAWNAYLERIRALRSSESEEYSEAYLSALDDARVIGATRTLRLASALSRFEREGADRTAHYDRVEELALAALELHDVLVEREDRITYEPAVGPRVSVDPVLQAAGTDPETQAMLEGTLDRVLDALSARGVGPVEAQALPLWVFEGLRDAVAPE